MPKKLQDLKEEDLNGKFLKGCRMSLLKAIDLLQKMQTLRYWSGCVNGLKKFQQIW